MRRLFKAALALLTIGVSVFLVQRSCHDEPVKINPHDTGGVAYSIRQPSPDASAERWDYLPKESEELARRSEELSERRHSDDRFNNTVTEQRVQGTWVLTGTDNTRLDLRIVNDKGMLKASFSESGRTVSLERTVRVIAVNDLALCSGSALKVDGTYEKEKGEMILILFDFRDGQSNVSWRREQSKEWMPLNVISHTR